MSEPKNIIKNHILLPVNARAHIKRDRSERPLRSTNKPRMIVDLLLDDVPLCLTDVSLELICLFCICKVCILQVASRYRYSMIK